MRKSGYFVNREHTLWASCLNDTLWFCLCSIVCPQGLWGEECAMTCDCSDRGTCLAANGACDCDPGWSGTRCDISKR